VYEKVESVEAAGKLLEDAVLLNVLLVLEPSLVLVLVLVPVADAVWVSAATAEDDTDPPMEAAPASVV